ncbi:fumarylacetoacetase [Methylobacterium indicum]|uniref:fumarylacetoacetase n=1 Tax=Methylobacterium indicum TaxID=1775910 RepID=A0A0J6RHP0_9HYPH|nr:fumarylacetoacetase [Methylobacterium indicum]KMO20762.1 fumarylacetoacetase [Methylobacterium indicum]KMO26431.1 fumarylacetoacetase [Methylobacterium indicum]BCM81643.1 fumarylacetoacetase [Methylobacterium indicum]
MTHPSKPLDTLDHTHDPALRSWVPGTAGHADFPIQNLPLGIFSPPQGTPRAGVAIGDSILDLPALLSANLLSGAAGAAAEAATGTGLNALLALGAAPRRALRAALSELLSEGCTERGRIAPLLHEAAACTLHLPAQIGDYTDFYVGIHHAENIGKQFRPDNPLLPNYKHVPIGYHGRASSIRPSGTPVRRPHGQSRAPDAAEPSFGPSQRLDLELELGVWIGPGNELGTPIPIGEAQDHIAGYCLLNDWSARDIQAWEYQPLGPFLAKNFASTISPWIVTPEALAPFRVPQAARPAGDPTPLPYLLDAADQRGGAFDISLDVLLMTPGLRAAGLAPHRISTSNTRHMYWTMAQMVAHHASGGCNLQPGDFLGTGTISGPGRDACGSLVEATLGGKEPIRLASGEERRFLEDGDEIILRARGVREGFATVGFGECRAVILGAVA